MELVAALHRAGVNISDIASVMPRAKWRSAAGHLEGEELIQALSQQDPKFSENLRRWFLDRPLHDADRTWVLSKMWGVGTTAILDELLEMAPSDGCSYRPS